MRVLQWNTMAMVLVAMTGALGASACGEVARTGRSPAYLVLDRLEGASGADPEGFSNSVASDVITLVRRTINGDEQLVPTVFADPGRATFRVGLKNPGTAVVPTAPTALNAITLTRFRVVFVRSDGRSTQGVDVPYAFDGGMTLTIPENGQAAGIFELVRIGAKQEAPLKALQNNGGSQFIATIAQISFYGYDQAGNEVTVSGSMSVSFADYGDPL